MKLDVLKTVRSAIPLVDASSDVIKAVQHVLKADGLYKGKVDGIPGDGTLKAFNEFKEAEYLGYPGLLGKSTVEALLETVEDRKANTDEPEEYVGSTAVIVGVGKVHSDQPIYEGSKFTWAEATKGMKRLPVVKAHTDSIIKVAQTMDKVRELLGRKPIIVTSWYRPPAVNRAVGGASNSRHIYGDGVDFQVQGLHPMYVYSKLNPWYGKKGGLASSNSFTHIDMRGFAARWRYN